MFTGSAEGVRAAVSVRVQILLPLLPVVYADREADRSKNLRYCLARALLPILASSQLYSPPNRCSSHPAILRHKCLSACIATQFLEQKQDAASPPIAAEMLVNVKAPGHDLPKIDSEKWTLNLGSSEHWEFLQVSEWKRLIILLAHDTRCLCGPSLVVPG